MSFALVIHFLWYIPTRLLLPVLAIVMLFFDRFHLLKEGLCLLMKDLCIMQIYESFSDGDKCIS